ncbi:MBL fold metallo-hydrolase [Salinimonas lutimaris]|uniref:MBL fold metallo-hydrolase n=1 Tax=Salinimonas lutimaris TaxID=914153 RepID=UPI0010C08437|nr:MBL fold metallo-hydrolase [Salinimonas lutimaris]
MKKILYGALVALAAAAGPGQAQNDFADVEIKDTPLRGAVHMLQGAGGNIGVSAGSDGILIIDDEFEPLAEKISAALGSLGQEKPKFIINTHFHGDHTGANAWFHEHSDSTILAHDNVRVRLASDSKVRDAALPVITFANGITMHFNDETLHIFHLPNGHTDGDAVVWFEQPNVLHTGDLFFNERFPFIDLKSGGSVDGYIKSVKTLLGKVNAKTIIVPGHGPLSDKTQYEGFLAMIEETKAFVDKHKADGKSAEDIVKAGLPEKWKSWSWSFINEEKWINTLYNG